ncbi:MAG: hypothetical protein KJP00_06650 [Bacteroidia bacterium]|nr:hypothetical protein [Bacteroidia bacterium]
MKVLRIIIAISIILGCAPQEQKTEVSFLLGEWKHENQEQFEIWELSKDGHMAGHTYRIKEGQKQIWETLSITEEGDQTVYRATVPDQNEGATVPFYLNTDIKDHLSFENEQHDFPKKIKYKHISEYQIEVEVLGAEGQGFSYIQTKQ